MLIAHLKIALLAWGERRRVGHEQPLLVTQDDLIERIVKFERDLNLLDAPVAAWPVGAWSVVGDAV